MSYQTLRYLKFKKIKGGAVVSGYHLARLGFTVFCKLYVQAVSLPQASSSAHLVLQARLHP